MTGKERHGADRLLTYPEAAEYLTLAEKTLRNLVAAYRCPVPFVKLGSGRRAPVRFKRSDLDRYIEAQTVPAQVGGES